MKIFVNMALGAAWILASSAYADISVNVVGLFNGKAVVSINGGKPQTLTVGKTSPEGVKLVSADSQNATLLIEGKQKTLGMGQAVSVAGSTPVGNQPVNLYANSQGHFLGDLSINGASLKFLVDTGATTIAMNSGDAKYANIDYKRGEQIPMSTANGLVNGYRVHLNTVKIGTITLNQVEATVLEGGFPQVVLLGMSALNRMDVKRDNSIMTLTKKF
jgi:aspartyl protease family protein